MAKESIMRLIKKLGFMIAYFIIPLPFIGYWLGGLYNFLAFYVIFATIPLIDILIFDSSNASKAEEA
jgi:alkane 1-monooxygenase